MKTKKTSSLVVAAVASSLFLGGCSWWTKNKVDGAMETNVKCSGVDSKGWVWMTEHACYKQGGKVIK